MLNTAVIGLGYSALTFHIPFISAHPDYNFCALVSRKKNALQYMSNVGTAAKESNNSIQCHLSIDALLEQQDIHLAIICLPNDMHYEAALKCIQQGVNVLIEKPFVSNTKEADSLISEAKKHQVQISVFHNRRYDGDFLSLQSIIKNNTLGKIHYFESHFDRFRPLVRQRWREQKGTATGILFDLGPHLIDQALVLFGEPKALTATTRMMRTNAESVDYFHIQFHYENVEVILHCSPFVAGNPLRFHLQGDKGSYIKHGLDNQEEALKKGIKPNSAAWDQNVIAQKGILNLEKKESEIVNERGDYWVFFDNLAKSLINSQAGLVTSEDGAATMHLIELTLTSAKHNKTILNIKKR